MAGNNNNNNASYHYNGVFLCYVLNGPIWSWLIPLLHQKTASPRLLFAPFSRAKDLRLIWKHTGDKVYSPARRTLSLDASKARFAREVDSTRKYRNVSFKMLQGNTYETWSYYNYQYYNPCCPGERETRRAMSDWSAQCSWFMGQKKRVFWLVGW